MSKTPKIEIIVNDLKNRQLTSDLAKIMENLNNLPPFYVGQSFPLIKMTKVIEKELVSAN